MILKNLCRFIMIELKVFAFHKLACFVLLEKIIELFILNNSENVKVCGIYTEYMPKLTYTYCISFTYM